MEKNRIRRKHAIFLVLAALMTVALAVSCGKDTEIIYVPYEEPPPDPYVLPEPLSNLKMTLGSPIRAAGFSDGHILTTDYRQGAVYFINSSTLEVDTGFRVLDRPTGLFYAGGKIYVSHESDGSVGVYSTQGRMLKRFGSGSGAVGLPNDLAVDEAAGLVFVVDTRNASVKRFTITGAYTGEISPSTANTAEDLFRPAGIALDTSAQRVYVSDYGPYTGLFTGYQPQIQVYDYAGNYVKSILPSAGYELSSPQGLAIDSTGDLYVADSFLRKVVVYGPSGTGIGNIGAGILNAPLDVLLDETSGDVFVTNNRTGSIEVFRGAMK